MVEHEQLNGQLKRDNEVRPPEAAVVEGSGPPVEDVPRVLGGVLALQRTAGNTAVTRLIKRTQSVGGRDPPDEKGNEIDAGAFVFVRAAAGSRRPAGELMPSLGTKGGFDLKSNDPYARLWPTVSDRQDLTILVGRAGRLGRQSAPPSPAAPPGTAPADAGAPPGALPPGEAIDFDGLHLATTADGLHRQLEEAVIAEGVEGPEHFLDRVQGKLADLDSTSGVPAGKEAALAQRDRVRNEILPLLRDQVKQIQDEMHQDVEDFEKAARKAIGDVLDDSEARTKAEAVRYGIKDISADFGPGEGLEIPLSPYTMDDTGGSRKLAAAASRLLERRKEIDDLKDELAFARANRKLPTAGPPTGDEATEFERLSREIERLPGEIAAKERDFEVLLSALQAEYPMLASFTQNRDDPEAMTAALTTIASGASPQAAELLGMKLRETLVNIAKVRKAAEPGGDLNPGKLPKIANLAKAAQGVAPHSVADRAIDAHIAAIEAAEASFQLALGVINLALVALAPATGGATLIVVAGLSTAAAVEHLEQFELEKAMTGSDLDKAKAISQEDPSLLWLALDIVFAVTDVGAAEGAAAKLLTRFKTLQPAAVRVVSARTAEELEQSLQALEEAAKAGEGGEKLAQAVRRDAEKLTKAAGKEGELAQDLERIGAAGQATKAELEHAITAETEGGHVHLTEDGKFFTCENPCLDPRDRFADVLGSDSELEGKLSRFEKQVAEQAKNPAELAKLKADAVALDNELFAGAVKTRAQRIVGALPALAERFPILNELKLDEEAVRRIIRKRNFDSLKGQLFEELTARRVQQLITTDEGRRLLGAPKDAKLEFIPGDRVRAVSTSSRGTKVTTQFSDGLVVIRDENGKISRIVSVIEAKAGAFSAEKLAAQSTPLKRLSKSAARERRLEAIDRFREEHATDPRVAGESLEKLDEDFEKEIDEVARKINEEEAGQVRSDIERLTEVQIQVKDTATGEFQNVTRGPSVRETKVVGFVPSDIDPAALKERIKPTVPGAKVGVETLGSDIDSETVSQLAQEIQARKTSGTR